MEKIVIRIRLFFVNFLRVYYWEKFIASDLDFHHKKWKKYQLKYEQIKSKIHERQG